MPVGGSSIDPSSGSDTFYGNRLLSDISTFIQALEQYCSENSVHIADFMHQEQGQFEDFVKAHFKSTVVVDSIDLIYDVIMTILTK